MTSLVLDLQKDAVDSKVSVSSLLRKALVVATKLKVVEFEEWINNELNGYDNADKIPEYRNIRGKITARNPVRGGLTPVMFDDPKFEKLLSSRKSNQPIPSLENVLGNSDDTYLLMHYPEEIVKRINEDMNIRTPIYLYADKSIVAGVVETVRNIVLKWTLKLEQDGITGKEMIFTENEKDVASGKNYILNNFFGPVIDTQIQQATQDSIQIIDKKEIDIDILKALIKEIKDNIKDVDLGDKKSEYDSEITTIETQIESPNPKSTIIRESLQSVRNILEGVAGNIIAAGLIYKIGEFF